MVALERHLAELGITSIAATSHHPQTLGKYERVHQTLQKWLAARPSADTLTELQDLLVHYRQTYNNRRHQSLDGDTPQQRYDARDAGAPACCRRAHRAGRHPDHHDRSPAPRRHDSPRRDYVPSGCRTSPHHHRPGRRPGRHPRLRRCRPDDLRRLLVATPPGRRTVTTRPAARFR
ncbi:integrase core domain-containing protein [Amycolatopsis kentuckyensis]|uniref:integrase core domain-containing protein n=1 Tax=Amycolatopsis kentuckyensis TaxID=218823 RepID=UPI003565D6BB